MLYHVYYGSVQRICIIGKYNVFYKPSYNKIDSYAQYC